MTLLSTSKMSKIGYHTVRSAQGGNIFNPTKPYGATQSTQEHSEDAQAMLHGGAHMAPQCPVVFVGNQAFGKSGICGSRTVPDQDPTCAQNKIILG